MKYDASDDVQPIGAPGVVDVVGLYDHAAASGASRTIYCDTGSELKKDD